MVCLLGKNSYLNIAIQCTTVIWTDQSLGFIWDQKSIVGLNILQWGVHANTNSITWRVLHPWILILCSLFWQIWQISHLKVSHDRACNWTATYIWHRKKKTFKRKYCFSKQHYSLKEIFVLISVISTLFFPAFICW